MKFSCANVTHNSNSGNSSSTGSSGGGRASTDPIVEQVKRDMKDLEDNFGDDLLGGGGGDDGEKKGGGDYVVEWPGDVNICPYCNQDPCVWLDGKCHYTDAMYTGLIWHQRCDLPFSPNGGKVKNNVYRFVSYSFWSDKINGPGPRKRLPWCVVRNIRMRYPDARGRYVGFKPKKQGRK